jgi:hypothetical protein
MLAGSPGVAPEQAQRSSGLCDDKSFEVIVSGAFRHCIVKQSAEQIYRLFPSPSP